MRKVICYISVLTTAVMLSACGQSGALHMPNDPNHDKRAKYLLYKNSDTTSQAETSATDAPVRQELQPATQQSTTP